MRWLVTADIHGNMTALNAVLSSPQTQSCDGIISLGDHTNYCPDARAVQLRLEALGAVMLRGNHEDRFPRIDTPEFAGYNWAPLRWTYDQLSGLNTDFPVDVRMGSVLCTHGTPGDPFHLIHPADLPPVLSALPEGVTHLLSGHSHASWLCEIGGKVACNPGSLGMQEDGHGCVAPFVIMDDTDGRITLTPCAVPYDGDEVARRFIVTGLAAVAPEMSRIVLHTVRTGEYAATLKLVRFVASHAAAMGLTLSDEEAWKAADPLYAWAEPMPSHVYWKQLEEQLL